MKDILYLYIAKNISVRYLQSIKNLKIAILKNLQIKGPKIDVFGGKSNEQNGKVGCT